ncbi:prephenate dehydrogenase [Bacillus solimangrovi]|uniref:Prephenate dehydrogenase n=1 Tax=Bacillus solimangrovi TaxID=1305675 RepID=A0A1E5LH91_9BACI|nr:prephenate dehydrogenase [Bacillus solimangrovi]OEH93442.1 prephenate dehydrogenase [Bacillus solimangrovi]
MSHKVFVIGLGLIGGSIALAIKREHTDIEIIGFDVHHEQVRMASSLHIIDSQAVSIKDGAEEADTIIISAPVTQTEKIIEQLVTYNLKPSVIVTDVGSTKQRVVEKAEGLISRGITFIGGHPMAGSHKSGAVAARAHLFENAFYIFTPSEETPREKVDSLQNLLKGTKATFVEMSPHEHDTIAGAISHFPHIVAAGLVHQVADLENQFPSVFNLAAGGFRDITRIASGSPIMWRDILLHNKDTMLHLIEKWQTEMNNVKEMITHLDSDGIYNYFEKAKSYRDDLPQKQRGALPSLYDLYVDVPDHPGAISDVTGILAQAKISITNIRIIEVREDIFGVLRLSFRNEADREKANVVLKDQNYDTYEMT